MQIGDDLIKARRFTDAAKAGLVQLEKSPDSMGAVLASIRDEATGMHARGIARTAECALEAMNESRAPENIHAHMFSLNRLLAQYTEGLDEIAPAQVAEAKIDTRTEIEIARETLTPLIRFAPAPEQQDALKFLAGFDPSAEAQAQDSNDVYLETIMPSVTDNILSEARHAGKFVSVSYAVGNIAIPEDIASDIQDFLMELGARFVADTLASPASRQAAGVPATGLVNIMAKLEHGTLALDIECTGRTSAKAPLSLKSLSPLIARSGIFSIEQTGDNTIARLVNVDLLPRPVISLNEPGIVLQEALI